MKNLLLGSLSLAAILAFSGCGGSEPKSIEELQKLSQDELKEISAKCGSVIDEPKNDEELNKKYLEIATKIVNARGQESSKAELLCTVMSFLAVSLHKLPMKKCLNLAIATLLNILSV